jgi:hypothetical protein
MAGMRRIVSPMSLCHSMMSQLLCVVLVWSCSCSLVMRMLVEAGVGLAACGKYDVEDLFNNNYGDGSGYTGAAPMYSDCNRSSHPYPYLATVVIVFLLGGLLIVIVQFGSFSP